MAARRCKYVEYDFVGDRWVIRPIWNTPLNVAAMHFELIGPDDPKVQVHVETVATAIDQMIDAALGVASTRMKMAASALEGKGRLSADPELPSDHDAAGGDALGH